MQKLNEKLYHAAIYLRLSQEDGDISVSDKSESNSISTQRDLIHAYLQKQPDILYEAEFCDDGYTGTNFDRPGFTNMMTAVREKRIDCIVVKDLSRFGRDYIESGKYIQKIFPMLGIRFIAINDGYDSADTLNQTNDFVPGSIGYELNVRREGKRGPEDYDYFSIIRKFVRKVEK